MKKLFSALAVLALVVSVNAQDRFELGIGAGTTHPMGGDTFKSNASTGDGQVYWLGYGLDKNWAVELGTDSLDFDKANSKHKTINLLGVYRFVPENWIHPIVKLGVTSVESKDATDLKTTSTGAKAAGGLEADFNYVSVGALFNYYYVSKTDSVLDLKDTQAFMSVFFLTIHNALGSSEDSKSEAMAPAAAAVVAKKDSDNDSVFDEDDKCPSTANGVIVNAFGCSEKEKASVKLNVEFASGKSDLSASHNSEIENLANFMKKFPETNVEIAGHTDNRGSAAANTALSQKRADAVKAGLLKAGVAESRVTAKGYGPTAPIADNKTKAARDQNRRVTAEISVTTEKKK
ncbi:MAG: OmpA family protein [Pseudobdellovibrio sp.]